MTEQDDFILAIEDLADEREDEGAESLGDLVRDTTSAAGQMAVVSKFAVS